MVTQSLFLETLYFPLLGSQKSTVVVTLQYPLLYFNFRPIKSLISLSYQIFFVIFLHRVWRSGSVCALHFLFFSVVSAVNVLFVTGNTVYFVSFPSFFSDPYTSKTTVRLLRFPVSPSQSVYISDTLISHCLLPCRPSHREHRERTHCLFMSIFYIVIIRSSMFRLLLPLRRLPPPLLPTSNPEGEHFDSYLFFKIKVAQLGQRWSLLLTSHSLTPEFSLISKVLFIYVKRFYIREV